MDECCLLFKVKSKKYTKISDEDYYDYVLNRGVTRESEIKADFVEILQNPSLMDQLPPLEMVRLSKNISDFQHEWFFLYLYYQEQGLIDRYQVQEKYILLFQQQVFSCYFRLRDQQQ